MVKIPLLIHSKLALALPLFLLLSPVHANPESSVKVQVTGSANTRDGALIDACRLAVAKVHGGRIAGALLKTNEKEVKTEGANAVIIGGPDSSNNFDETRDATALGFDGLLRSYSIISQQEPSLGSSIWQIEIEADVLKAIPDRFAGRIMVVTPSMRSLQNKLGNKAFAKALSGALENWFANSKQFALLERRDESALNEELARAASASSAVNQKSKLGAQKAADVVILVDGGEIEFDEKSTSFRTTSRQSHTCRASCRITIKAIDTATKGEIGRTVVELEAKKSTTDPGRSRKAAVAMLADQLEDKMYFARLELMGALDVTRLVVDEGGYISVISPVDGLSLERLNSITLSYTKSETETISFGVFELEEDGTRLSGEWKEKGVLVNQIMTFTPSSKNP